jgi:NDP-sugar pyrophosphorylase family protein
MCRISSFGKEGIVVCGRLDGRETNQRSAMQAVLLAGGLGTRVASVSQGRPKALMPVYGRPFIEYLIRYLRAQGCLEVVLCAGRCMSQFKLTLGTGAKFDLDIVYVREDDYLGTGGAVKNALPLIHDDQFFVLNADIFAPIDLSILAHNHRQLQAQTTLAITAVDDRSAYGAISISPGGDILSFGEKSVGGYGLVSVGIYAFNIQTAMTIPNGVVSLERDFFPGLVGKGLKGVQFTCSLLDIGTPASYENTCKSSSALFELQRWLGLR